MGTKRPTRVDFRGAQPRPRLVDVFAGLCSHPSCDSPAFENVACQTPLCELHLFDAYKATNQLLTVHNPRQDEYALLPSEQQQIPGPCPACGHAGYLMQTVTDQVRCLNSSCYYEAHVVQFESVRRGLMFMLAGSRPVVYYIKFRDCVKIGTSRNLKNRWNALNATEMLYGIEYGDYRLERKRHQKFAPYRTHGEWFEDNCHLRAHINDVCVTAA